MSAFDSLGQSDFHRRLATTAGAALVFFTVPACGSCRRLRRVLAHGAWRGLALFEVDAERESGLVHEFEVTRLPALHLFRNGCYHAPVEAQPTPERLQAAIAAALQAPAREAP